MRKTLLLSLFLLQLAYSQSQETALKYVQLQKEKLHLQETDIAEMRVNNHYTSQGITYTYFLQRYQGIPVFNAILNAVQTPNRGNFVSGNRFVQNIALKTNTSSPSLSAQDAIAKAANALNLGTPTVLSLISSDIGTGADKHQKYVYSNGNIARTDISAELYWQAVNEKVNLAWNVRIYAKNTADWWEIRIDANSGAELDRNNWTVSCDFSHEHEEQALLCDDAPTQLQKTSTAGDFQIFDWPLEAPSFGSRTTVNNPWERAGIANPVAALGWLNDGTSSYTMTRGNNVWVKDDIANDNETTLGVSPTSATQEFVFPFTNGATPAANYDAAATNLFFWNNLVHDVTYQYGFDEVSGNFQNDNLSRGGAGADYVNADALDGSGTNNANFSTPPDGTNSRMQMFIWNAASKLLTINTPPVIAGPVTDVGTATFGPQSFDVTGDVVLADDGVAPLSNGCEAIINAVSGKIALIDRGICSFAVKVKNAQNAGAIAVLIANNAPGAAPAMGGSDPTITIPVLSVSLTMGNQIKTELLSGTVNVRMQAAALQFDSGVDNGVIAHEYGHGISNRLTGGPSVTSCLANAEQMGEGWSDYIALMLTTDWATANKMQSRTIGTYVSGQSPSGSGIRQYPYSYDMSVSLYNYDYARTAGTSVHNRGAAWCAMIWDMTWNIIDMTPASTDIYHGTGGNNIALQLVMDGMKLQACSPGFVDGRDAILLADEIRYGGIHRCAIWNAFARRGLGFSASQGSSNNGADGNSAIDVPLGVNLVLTPDPKEVVVGEVVNYSLAVQCQCQNRINLELTATLPPEIDYVNGSASSGGTESASTITWPFFNLPSATTQNFTFQGVINSSAITPLEIWKDDAESGLTNWTSAQLSGNPNAFTVNTTRVKSGTQSFSAPDVALPSEIALTQNTPFALPASGPIALRFWHWYDTEPTFDGGVVEISTNSGGSWSNLQSLFTVNGYNQTIATTDNVLTGMQAFSGSSLGMIMSEVDLSSFAGQNVIIRFRMGTDTGNSGGGTSWTIDDVQIVQGSTACLNNVAEIFFEGFSLDNTNSCFRMIPSLPVSLLNFHAENQEDKVNLSWTTSSEQNSAYFEVERSENMQNFSAIAHVNAAGNSNTMRTYQSQDFAPLNERSYYRLKMVDLDGSYAYSSVQEIFRQDKKYFTLYPNPATHSITLRSQQSLNGTIEILSLAGQRLKQIEAKDAENLEIDLQGLPAGVYLLRIGATTLKFTKQ